LPGAKLIDRSTGQEKYFLEEEIKDALSSGSYVLDPSKRYNVHDINGKLVSVDATQFVNYLDRDLPVEDLQGARARASNEFLDKAYGGVTGGVMSATRGLLSGATAGLSEIAIEKGGDKYFGGAAGAVRDYLNLDERALAQGLDPGTYSKSAALDKARSEYGGLETAGEVVGVLGTAGASLAGRGAAQMLPTGAAALAGEKVFGKVAGKAGAGALRKAGASAAAGAVDVGIYSGVQSFSNAVINDKPLSWETALDIFSDAGKGAALGAAFAGGASLIGSGISKARNLKNANKVNNELIRGTKEFDDYAFSVSGGIRGLDDASHFASRTIGDELAAVKKTRAMSKEDIKLVKSVQKQLDADLREVRSVFNVRRNLDDTVNISEKNIERLITQGASGKQVTSLVNLQNTLNHIKKLELPSNQALSRRLSQRVEEMVTPFELSIAEKTAQATGGLKTLDVIAIANELNLDMGAIPPGSIADSALKLYGVSRLTKGGYKKIKGRGPSPTHGRRSFGQSLKGGIEKGATISVARSARTRSPGLLGSMQAGIMGSMAGLAIKRGMERLGSGSRTVAAKTSEVNSKMLRAARFIAGPKKPIQQRARRTMNAILSQTMFDKADEKKAASKQSRDNQYLLRERAKEIQQMAADNRTLELKIKTSLGSLILENPELADKIIANATNKIQYLASKIPSIPSQNALTPKTLIPVSETEISKFANIMRLTDPSEFINDLESGRINKISVEAAQAMYPEVYGRMRKYISDNLMELREDLPYEKRLIISRFFQVPVERFMEPEAIQRLQNMQYPEEQGGTQAPAPRSGMALGSFSQKLTAGQHIQDKE
jgi:hypothetical protein